MPDPEPATPDPPAATPSRRGGRRPGAGRKPGPSRTTLARWDYIAGMFAHDPVLIDTFSDFDLMRLAASRCLATGDLARAADFARACRRLHARSSRIPFPLDLKVADRKSNPPQRKLEKSTPKSIRRPPAPRTTPAPAPRAP